MRSPIRGFLALAFLFVATAFVPPSSTPSQQLFMLKQLQPDLTRVGLLWDGNLGDADLKRAQRAAVSHGVELMLARVEATRDVGPAFRELARTHDIQALWILSDEGLTAREPSRSFLLREAARAGIPVLSPSAGWVEAGATLAVLEGAEGVRLVINRPASEALSLQVPEQYAAVTDFLASR
jgi:ABC-type uncharacterized transport system substrate-binding protein